jgi:hypothetical protein
LSLLIGGDGGVAVFLAEYKAGWVADCADCGATGEKQEGEKIARHAAT